VPIEVCLETLIVAMRSQRKPIEAAGPSLRARLGGFDATRRESSLKQPVECRSIVVVQTLCEFIDVPHIGCESLSSHPDNVVRFRCV